MSVYNSDDRKEKQRGFTTKEQTIVPKKKTSQYKGKKKKSL